MAPENNENRAGEDGRRSGRDRRPPPLTIDLTAEKAAATANAGVGNDAPRDPPKRLLPGLSAIIPSSLDREAWVGIGSAAALGGVVALLLLLLFQALGVVPAPGAGAAKLASNQAKAASDAVAAIDHRLGAVEAMTDGLPALRSDLTATATHVASLEQATAGTAAKSDLDGLRADIAALQARLDKAPQSATAADLAALTARVGRVETAGSTGAAAPVGAAQPTSAVGDAAAQIAALSARLDTDEAAIARLTSAPAAAATGVANARAAAIAALRGVVDSGKPFAPELEVVAALGADQIASGLKPYAAAGIATRDALRADFAKVEDAILAATQGADDSLFGRIVAGARSLVSVRPTTPVDGNDPTAIVSRMDAAVARGDLAVALHERDALPTSGKDASADWAAQAAARIAADGLLATTAGVGNG